MSKVLVIQHVPHERLGSFEPAFKRLGGSITTLNAYEPKAVWPSRSAFDGLVVFGGPQGAYEQAKYPYLTKEIQLLREAVKAEQPILGICLGAQLLAAALGAKVSPNAQKEIGWHPVMRESGADTDPMWDAFGQTETVFQWHGDTFALPKGATQLASSPLCEQQAFRFGRAAYGLQFHVEVTDAIVRAWLTTPVNKAELAKLKGQVDPLTIRRQSPQHAGRMAELAQHMTTRFYQLMGDKPNARKVQSPRAAQR